MNPTDRAMPGVNLSYAAKGLVKELHVTASLRHVCRNFTPQDHWHKLSRELNPLLKLWYWCTKQARFLPRIFHILSVFMQKLHFREV